MSAFFDELESQLVAATSRQAQIPRMGGALSWRPRWRSSRHVLTVAASAAVVVVGIGLASQLSNDGDVNQRAAVAPAENVAAAFPELDRAQSLSDRVVAAPHGVNLRTVRLLPSPLEGWKFWIARSTGGEVEGDGVCLLWLDPEAAKIATGPGGSCQPISRLGQGVLASSSAGQTDPKKSRLLWLVPRSGKNPRVEAADGTDVPLATSGSLRVSAPVRLSGTRLTVDGKVVGRQFLQESR